MSIRRREVLSLYRRILRLAQNWTAKDPASLSTERNYIADEAKSQFRKNKNMSDDSEIGECLRKADHRIEIAIHYQNPYPRPVNVLPKAMARNQAAQSERFKKLS